MVHRGLHQAKSARRAGVLYTASRFKTRSRYGARYSVPRTAMRPTQSSQLSCGTVVSSPCVGLTQHMSTRTRASSAPSARSSRC